MKIKIDIMYITKHKVLKEKKPQVIACISVKYYYIENITLIRKYQNLKNPEISYRYKEIPIERGGRRELQK